MNMYNLENKIVLIVLVTSSTMRFKSKLEWIWNDFVTHTNSKSQVLVQILNSLKANVSPVISLMALIRQELQALLE